jgi:tRNA (guanine37-N1)-methyltransferase
MTLFPEMVENFLSESIIGRARNAGKLDIRTVNIRDFSEDKHHRVDDTPYGGGRGMLMAPDPIYNCYRHLVGESESKPYVVYMSPKGRTFNQSIAKSYSSMDWLVLLCGHYEGIDQRVIDKVVDEEISIGDYVLTGGELPAMVLIDSVSRYVPGVLTEESTDEESFSEGLLEYPQYTRPEIFDGVRVPEVLLSGHHENIKKWRRLESLRITYKNRPELLENVVLTDEEKDYIEKLKKEVQG